MSDDQPTAHLVTSAAAGDRQGWDALVDRYAPVVWSICRRHGLSDAEAGHVGQAVWMQLASQLGTARDPAALAGWLAAATARECGQVRRAAQAGTAEHELRAAVRDAVLREALTRLPPGCRQLIIMLTEDPPVPNAQISTALGIPADSIGPACGRGLDELRRDPAVAALGPLTGSRLRRNDRLPQIIAYLR